MQEIRSSILRGSTEPFSNALEFHLLENGFTPKAVLAPERTIGISSSIVANNYPFFKVNLMVLQAISAAMSAFTATVNAAIPATAIRNAFSSALPKTEEKAP